MENAGEYLHFLLHPLRIYYILTTLKEDVSITFPQKWNFGKALFILIRYGMCVFIALQLTRNFRNYYPISPIGCKVLWVIYDFAHWFVQLACDVSLGLCLAALLRARWIYIIPLLLICVTPSCLGLAFNVVGNIQYPAEPITSLDAELGYPCYVPSSEAVLTFVARDIRAYISLATTALLLVLGVVTMILRYRGQNSGLVKVLRRDGGLYYVLLTGMRFVAAIFNTPSVMPANSWDGSTIFVLYISVWDVFIPILAQRLMINMRKVDYVGTRPVASTLLFAAPDSGSQTAQGEIVAEGVEMSGRASTGSPAPCKV